MQVRILRSVTTGNTKSQRNRSKEHYPALVFTETWSFIAPAVRILRHKCETANSSIVTVEAWRSFSGFRRLLCSLSSTVERRTIGDPGLTPGDCLPVFAFVGPSSAGDRHIPLLMSKRPLRLAPLRDSSPCHTSPPQRRVPLSPGAI